MTTIIAVRENGEKGKICMIADSMTRCGERKKIGGGRFFSSPPKLSICGDSIVGCAGNAIWTHAIKNFFADQLSSKSFQDPGSLVDDLYDFPFLAHPLYAPAAEQKKVSYELPDTLVANIHGIF